MRVRKPLDDLIFLLFPSYLLQMLETTDLYAAKSLPYVGGLAYDKDLNSTMNKWLWCVCLHAAIKELLFLFILARIPVAGMVRAQLHQRRLSRLLSG